MDRLYMLPWKDSNLTVLGYKAGTERSLAACIIRTVSETLRTMHCTYKSSFFHCYIYNFSLLI